MKNVILILVAALFAFNVSAQTQNAGTDKVAKQSTQKEISVEGSEKDKVVVLQVDNIKDELGKVEKELKAIKGVKKVVMDVAKGIATVTYDEAIATPTAMIASLKKVNLSAKIQPQALSKEPAKVQMKTAAPDQKVSTKEQNLQKN